MINEFENAICCLVASVYNLTLSCLHFVFIKIHLCKRKDIDLAITVANYANQTLIELDTGERLFSKMILVKI